MLTFVSRLIQDQNDTCESLNQFIQPLVVKFGNVVNKKYFDTHIDAVEKLMKAKHDIYSGVRNQSEIRSDKEDEISENKEEIKELINAYSGPEYPTDPELDHILRLITAIKSNYLFIDPQDINQNDLSNFIEVQAMISQIQDDFRDQRAGTPYNINDDLP